MFKIFEKFLIKFKKLENYYILRQEQELIIVGTKIIIKEHKVILGNIFQPQSKNIDKELPVFFLISIKGTTSLIDKDFIRYKLPILILNKNQLLKEKDDLKDILDEFLVGTFKS